MAPKKWPPLKDGHFSKKITMQGSRDLDAPHSAFLEKNFSFCRNLTLLQQDLFFVNGLHAGLGQK